MKPGGETNEAYVAVLMRGGWLDDDVMMLLIGIGLAGCGSEARATRARGLECCAGLKNSSEYR
jgi:hypothetical protein